METETLIVTAGAFPGGGEVGQRHLAAQVGEDEECRPRLATELRARTNPQPPD